MKTDRDQTISDTDTENHDMEDNTVPDDAAQPLESKLTIDPDAIIRARMITRACELVRYKNVVGRCRNILHPGKLTSKLMEKHDCLNKQCPYFVKYEDSAYWDWLERQREHKEKAKCRRKAGKKAKKEQKHKEAERFEELKVLFQSYADEAGYTMQIVRVHGVQSYIYVFYVSDNPFADWKNYPAFRKSVKFFFPHHRLVLRRIKNVDGHFMTRKEYAKLKR